MSYCFLIPLHNEGKIIERTISSLHKAGIDYSKVFLVDDGSTDDTLHKLFTLGFPAKNVLGLSKNVGKVQALKTAFKHFKLDKFTWVATLDGDGVVQEDYKEVLEKALEKHKDAAGICGHVRPLDRSKNLFTAYRLVEYFLTHWIYKRAQSHMNVLAVLPGCSAVMKSSIFKELLGNSDPNMLAEDMDWTIEIQQRKLGKIPFESDLVLYTQDPNTFSGYKKQILRWYRGLWQVVRKRKMLNISKGINAEVSFLVTEGLIYSVGFLLASIFTVVTFGFHLGNLFLLLDASLFLVYCLSTSIAYRDTRPLLFFPAFYLVRWLNAAVFVYTFLEIIVLRMDKKKKFGWNQVARY